MPGGLGQGRRRGCHMNTEQVVFLVGGLGTRLQALTANTAKPVLGVGGRRSSTTCWMKPAVMGSGARCCSAAIAPAI